MDRLSRALGALCLFVPLLLLGEIAAAQSWDAFPNLRQGRRLALAPSVDASPFQDTNACLRRTSKSGASFYAAVVNVTDPRGRTSAEHSNAVPYVDALYAQWRKNRPIDSAEHVLIAVSLANRGIAIHPGTRWADLGFEGRAITRAIDNSRFAGLARNGEMGRALCALAEDLDVTLGNLARRESLRVQDQRTEVQKLSAARTELRDRAKDWAAISPEASTDWQRRLNGLEDDTAASLRALAQGRLSVAADASRSIAREQKEIEDEIALAQEARKSLETLRPALQEREQEAARLPASDGFARARLRLAECTVQVDGLETSILVGEAISPRNAESCLEEFDNAVDNARAAHAFRTVVLPLLIFLALSAIGTILLGFQVFRLRRARKRGRELIDAWGTRLDRIADQLLEVENRHPLYFTPELGRWRGESRELDQRAAEAVNRVYLLYSSAHLLLGRAREALADLGFLDFSDLDRVETLLRDTPVSPGSDAMGEVKLRLPGAPPPEAGYTASEVLEEIDRLYQGLTEHLTEVTRVAERFWELVREADVAAGEASEACTRRGELNSPVENLSRELEPILDRRRQAMDLSDDPVAANPALEEVLTDLRAVRDRATLGNGILETLRGEVTETARGLVTRLRSMREEGFRLDEPGFAPDLRLEQARAAADDIEDAIADGREEEASRRLDALRFSLEELKLQLDAVAHTREHLPRLRDGFHREVKALEIRIPPARKVLQELRREHDPEAFAVESDNLEELDDLLGTFERWSEELQQSYDRGYFLAASESLTHGDGLIAEGTALLDGLDTILDALEESRDQALESAAAGERLEEKLESLIAGPGIDGALAGEIEAAVERSRELRTATEIARPHWPRLDEELDAHLIVLEGLLARGERQAGDFLRARELAEALDQRGVALAREAAGEHRDRPFVEEAVATVRRELEIFKEELAAARPGGETGGSALLQKGEQMDGRLDWAEDLWRSEMDLVRSAESKLQAAEHRVSREHGRSFGYGIVASCRHARDLLHQARGLRAERQWERVLELAGRAVASADEEARRCRREAAEREEEERRRRERIRRAEERRRRELAAAAAAAAARAAVAAASSRSRRTSSFGGFGGSGSSGRSGSSRRSGSSGGSSFGGSRSGGSRW